MMKIFVISLQRAVERRAAVSEQFANTALHFEFFDAVDGNDAGMRRFAEFDARAWALNTDREPAPGEIACYASHLELWQYAARNNEPIIILEDDCQLEPSFQTAVQTVSQQISQFGVIRLQSSLRNRWITIGRTSQRLRSADNFDLYYLFRPPLCTTGYAVSPEAAANLASASNRLVAPVDKYMQRTWLHQTPIFGLEPASISVSALGAESDIGDRSLCRQERIPAIRRAVYKISSSVLRHKFNRQHWRRVREQIDFGEKRRPVADSA